MRVVHATDRWVIIDKPSGLLSVPGKDPAMAHAVAWCRATFPRASGPITVHRLDMDTSGCLLLALDAGAQRELSMQFEARAVEKLYQALLLGRPPHDSGSVDVPMRADITNRPVQVLDRSHGRPALTAYKVIETVSGPEGERARVELIPHTGRSHQLRLHMAHLGCPIAGDPLYGPQPGTRESAPRLCLHAHVLTITDPSSGQRVRAVSAAPF